MVDVAGQTFAVPLSGVLESIRVKEDDIHEVATGEIIKLRDRLLPIFRLDRFFGRVRGETPDSYYVVIVGSGEKQGGLIVDRLVGQQEIVIKALDDYLGDVPGISGGSVLGDGKISLIIDIASFFRQAQ
jgi:two-component system chemotaxis sensor kinase CheA